MKFIPRLMGSLVLLVAMTNGWAAAPATNAAPVAPAPNKAALAPVAKPAPAPVVAPAPAPAPALKLGDFIDELATTLKLSDADKKKIEAIYVADGATLQGILNNDALSPLQKAQEVSDLRDARNTKVVELLPDAGQQTVFFQIEAKYRVALTGLAADGGWVADAVPAK